MIVHHSPGDWDYQAGRGFFLDPSRYVVAPNCLARPVGAASGTSGWVMMKPTVYADLQDGRVTHYHYMNQPTNSRHRFYFRAQAVPAGDDPANCYYYEIRRQSVGTSSFGRYVAGVQTVIASFWEINLTAWVNMRYTWYSYLDQSGGQVMSVKCEEWNGASWTQLHALLVASPLWQTDTPSRIGFNVPGTSGTARGYIDTIVVERRTI